MGDGEQRTTWVRRRLRLGLGARKILADLQLREDRKAPGYDDVCYEQYNNMKYYLH